MKDARRTGSGSHDPQGHPPDVHTSLPCGFQAPWRAMTIFKLLLGFAKPAMLLGTGYMATVCVVVGGYLYDTFCGAENGEFSCPAKTRPQDPRYDSHGIHIVFSTCRRKVLTQNWCLWGRKIRPQDITPWYSHCFLNMPEKSFNAESKVKRKNRRLRCFLQGKCKRQQLKKRLVTFYSIIF